MATGVLLKGLYFAWMLRSNDYAATGFLGNFYGDSDSYVSPVHHLIYEGSFEPDFRMPGYAAFFYLPCLLLPMAAAMNVMIFLQLLLAGVSVYLLARSAEWLTGRRRAFYIAFWLLGFSTWANTYDTTILSESLSASLLALLVFCFAGLLRSPTKALVAGAGISFLALVFVKPIFAPLGAPLALLLGWHFRKEPRFAFRTVLLVLLPFLICDGLWVARNYRHHGKFLPLNTSFLYPLAEKSSTYGVMMFLHAWGGNDMGWESGSDIRWFYPKRGVNWNERDSLLRPPFPESIYTSAFNADSLVVIRNQLAAIYVHPDFLTPDSLAVLDQSVRARLLGYTASISHQRPAVFYLRAPLVNLERYLLHTGRSLHTPPDAPLHTRLLEKVYEGWYVVTVLLGLAGMLAGWWILRNRTLFLFLVFPVLYIALVYPVIFRYSEMRYLMPVYPLLLVLGACIIDRATRSFLNKGEGCHVIPLRRGTGGGCNADEEAPDVGFLSRLLTSPLFPLRRGMIARVSGARVFYNQKPDS